MIRSGRHSFLIGAFAAFCIVVAGFTIQGLLARPPRDQGNSFTCDVAAVHDGDTLRCRDGTRIRLNAINARELDGSCGTGHPCPAGSAEAARALLTRLAAGRRLVCEPTGNSYGRVTAWCAADGRDLSCAMVRAGMAARWARYDPDERLRRCTR